jgi:hydroxylamine reductase
MSNMFCFQCEQTVGGKGCTVAGACGKTADTANLQDGLTLALINFAIANEGREITNADAQLLMEGLFTTITNVSFDDVSLNKLVAKVEAAGEAKRAANKLLVSTVLTQGDQLFAGDPDVVSLRSLLLLGLRGMAAYAYHALMLGKSDAEVNQAMFDGMPSAETTALKNGST